MLKISIMAVCYNAIMQTESVVIEHTSGVKNIDFNAAVIEITHPRLRKLINGNKLVVNQTSTVAYDADTGLIKIDNVKGPSYEVLGNRKYSKKKIKHFINTICVPGYRITAIRTNATKSA